LTSPTTRPAWNPLLDAPVYPAERFAPLADRIATLLRTKADVLLIQGEAILALEAVASSLGRPGVRALNIVSSPYGTYFGTWLRRARADVVELVATPGQPIEIGAVQAALAALPAVDLIAIVHGEAANGAVNPIAEIAALARSRGALSIVDAVASVGAHDLGVDQLGIDVCVIGPQKALGGPAGLSAISVSKAAWCQIQGPAISSLSLLDQKTNWIDRGRGVLPGTPSGLEFWALEAALDRVEAEGIDALVNRHQRRHPGPRHRALDCR
jgi:aspartate aminotransferase-like enzyme